MLKHILTLLLSLFWLSQSSAQSIVEAEYWFDENYTGKVSQTISSGASVSFITNVNTTGLSASLHSIHLRFKDNIGKWSAPVAGYFFKSSQIVAYRYWFDTTYSSAQTVVLPTAQHILHLNNIINANAMPPGLSVVHFQFKNNLGVWSSVVSDSFWNAAQTCVNWTDFSSDSLTFNAVNYLCTENIVQAVQSDSNNKKAIIRQYLAKIVYLGLFGTNAITPADSFTSMFYDLQNPNVPYYKWAKALSFLEYSDGISPFSRVFSHFRPGERILRKDAMKVFTEAWNLPLNTGGPSPFNDVSTSDPMYPWINTMHANGIIYGTGGGSFSPDSFLTRNEAFIILYRMLMQLTKPVPQNSDFYRPFNLTPKNANRILSIGEGNFSNYTKTSFAINGLMPLAFEHHYNSSVTELPEEYFERSTLLLGRVYNQNVLGKGWSHNYNSYIVPIFGDTANSNSDDRILVRWGNGETVLFKYAGVGLPYISDALGNYDELVSTGGQFLLTTKSQIKYYFQPMTVGGDAYIAPLIKIKDRNNNETNLSWNMYTASGNNAPRLDTITDPSGRTLSFAYNNSAYPYQITSVTASTGSIVRGISFGYNADGQLTSYTDPKNQTTTYSYNSNGVNKGLLTSIMLPKGNTINNTYQNRKLQSLKMNGNALEIQTNPVNSYIDGTATTQATTTMIRNGLSMITNATYNELGKMNTVQAPGVNLSAQYNDANNPGLPTNINNLFTAISGGMTYDSKGNLLSVTKTNGSQAITESYTYNTLNDVTSHTDGRNNTTSFGYTNGNLTSIQHPIGTTTISYNTDGTVASVTNPSNIATTYNYNNYGNIIGTTLAGLITSTTSYDDASRMTGSTDPNGVITTFSYDDNDNRLSDHLDPPGLTINTTYAFDLNDNLASITNALSGITALTYDSTDMLVQQSFGGYNKQFEYNEDGTVKKITTQNNIDFNYAYNTDGQVTSDGYATYAYNVDKTLNTIAAGGKTLTYGYDGLKRITSVSYDDFSGNTVSYQYDNNNNITQINYPNNPFIAKYDYDANNRLIAVKDGGNSVICSYSYFNDGRLQQQTNSNGTVTEYFYDAAGRMDSMVTLNSSNTVIAAYGFSLDNNGNHTQEKSNIPNGLSLPPLAGIMVSATYTNNRIQQYDGVSYTHDGNGNHLTAGPQFSYVWDAKDNLNSYTNTGNTNTYEYDGIEARRKKNNTRFVLDALNNNNVLMETDNAGNPITIYVHALGLVCRITPGTGTKHFYHYDYRGSTVAITDNNQAVAHRYLYGAFGEDYGAQEAGFSNPFRYVGKYGVMYEDSTLYFMRARYYNPKLGRFLGEDPVWGTNLMAYCGNNPVGFIDPDGEKAEVPTLAGYNLDINVTKYQFGYRNAQKRIALYLNAKRIISNMRKLRAYRTELNLEVNSKKQRRNEIENELKRIKEQWSQLQSSTEKRSHTRSQAEAVHRIAEELANSNEKLAAELQLIDRDLLNVAHELRVNTDAQMNVSQEWFTIFEVGIDGYLYSNDY